MRVDASPLRIAVLSPIAWRTPPHGYGPWELFASLLTEGLVANGHAVTLFATADSVTNADLVATSPHGWETDRSIDTKVAECTHIASVFELADQFDIIHNSFDFLPLTYSCLVETPVVTTIHGFSSENIVEVYRRYNEQGHYVAISDSNRHPDLDYVATIHHGLDTTRFGRTPIPGDDLLFFGRIHPDKGTHHAIDVALKTGRSLTIAGIIADTDYFDEMVRPHLEHELINYVGHISGSEKTQMLSSAFALVHLIDFDEPFGFSVAEALLSGTPVIAHRRGSMPELIDHGNDGFIIDNPTDAARHVEQVARLDRTGIADRARARFDARRMADDYATLYRRILDR